MSELFALSMPWWHFAVRGGVTYLGLLILLRWTGKRAFGEMSPFDIVVLILVGGVLRSAVTGNDTSVLGAFIGVATILALDKALAALAARSGVVNRLLEGRSSVLAHGGRLIPGALLKANIAQEAFARELRTHQVRSLEEVEEARLEATGKISVFKRPTTN